MDIITRFGKKNIAIVAAVIVVIAGIFYYNHQQNTQLSGKYTATINMLIVQGKDTLTFNGNQVKEYSDTGELLNAGTYKLANNRIEMNINSYKMVGNLSDDHKTITITDADNALGLGNGLKYVKDAS